jgi:hypothetical protein
MIRGITQSNTLFSASQANYQQYVQSSFVYSLATNYNLYNCASASACIDQSVIDNYSNGIRLFIAPDFYAGCYAIQSLF